MDAKHPSDTVDENGMVVHADELIDDIRLLYSGDMRFLGQF